MRRLLTAAVCGGLALGPALAWADDPYGATFKASDGPPEAWQGNGTAATTVRIAPGQSVTFSNPAKEFHNLKFADATSQCPDVPISGSKPGWSETCTFTVPGTYDFICEFHAPGMAGRVIVEAPTPTPTPEGTAAPVATATPGATATPVPPSGGTAPPAKLAVTLAARQRGARVRGTARVPAAGSRLEVTLRAHGARVGHWVAGRAAKGTARFSVPVNAKARRALPLAISVTVVLTPPGGKALMHRQAVMLRR